jgi:hypothetical protein
MGNTQHSARASGLILKAWESVKNWNANF